MKENKTVQVTAGSNLSYWTQSVRPLEYIKLQQDIDTEVVIIGGGIAGLSVAYCAAKAGKQVVLVEDGFIGSGETGRTTAHLASALDDRFYNLEKVFGEEKTRLIAESHMAAIDFIEDTINREKIDCDFARLNGYLFLHPSDKKESLDKELKAARRAGLHVRLTDGLPGISSYKGHAIEFSGQGRFHSLKYLKGLCEAIERYGGKIFTSTHAKQIDHTGIVTNEGRRVKAQHVVVATHTPVNNKYTMHLKQYAYRTYAIGARIKKGVLPDVLLWDTGDFSVNEDMPPYHYVRLQGLDDTHDLLIAGGEDHPTGLPESDGNHKDRFAAVEEWTKKYFPVEDVLYKWSGQIMEPMDSLAYIGRNPHDKENMFIVTGDSGNGITHSTIAGILITDLIRGISNRWEEIYDPSRFKIFSSGNVFFKEMVGGLISYYRNKKVAASNELFSLKANEGIVVENADKKYGVYRDEKDEIHFVSAECSHMGCTVKWNPDEKSWDCPCHGSRYDHTGKVMNGPANSDLPYHSSSISSLVTDRYASREK